MLVRQQDVAGSPVVSANSQQILPDGQWPPLHFLTLHFQVNEPGWPNGAAITTGLSGSYGQRRLAANFHFLEQSSSRNVGASIARPAVGCCGFAGSIGEFAANPAGRPMAAPTISNDTFPSNRTSQASQLWITTQPPVSYCPRVLTRKKAPTFVGAFSYAFCSQ